MQVEDNNDASSFERYAVLRSQLFDLEEQLGLVGITEHEEKILCALIEESSSGMHKLEVPSSALRGHVLCKAISQPSYYRGLQRLEARRILVRTKTEGRPNEDSFLLVLK